MTLIPIKGNVDVSVNADLTEASNEFIKTASNSIQGIQETVQKPIQDVSNGLLIAVTNIIKALGGEWVAQRIGNMNRTKAQAERDCIDIANGVSRWDSKEQKLFSINQDTTLQQCCLDVTHAEEIQKAERLFKGISETLKQLKDYADKIIPDTPINKNFFSHWRDEAELIDDEEIRKFWSRLLTGEICNPNSISIKTLNTVKNLSQEEARIFSRLVCYRVSGGIILDSNSNLLHGNYLEKMQLIDAGLIMPEVSSLTINDSVILSNNKCYLFALNQIMLEVQSKNAPKINAHLLTKVGKELLTLLDNDVSVEVIKEIGIAFSKANGNCKVALHNRLLGATQGDVFEITPFWTYPLEGITN